MYLLGRDLLVMHSTNLGGMPDYADSYEDVSKFTLADDRERALLDAQTECCFMWTTKAGDPVGVIMNYVARDGRFWVPCTKRRKRVAAVAARPRVALAITSRGTQIGVSQTVTYKGGSIIHDDDETKAWFYPALAARVRPESEDHQQAVEPEATQIVAPSSCRSAVMPEARRTMKVWPS